MELVLSILFWWRDLAGFSASSLDEVLLGRLVGSTIAAEIVLPSALLVLGAWVLPTAHPSGGAFYLVALAGRFSMALMLRISGPRMGPFVGGLTVR